MEEEIIQPISKEILKSELTPERRLRMTNKSHNEIYVVTAKNSPNVMQEIGRLREVAFRTAGGGTGKAADIDEFDTMDDGCRQLIVWNPEAEEIIVPIGTCSGQTLKQVAERRPASLKWYVKGYSGDDNILRAGAKLMLDKLQRLANAS